MIPGVCILNWNAGDALLACVRSVAPDLQRLRGRLVVVDNGSSDDSIASLLREYPDIPVITSTFNGGYAIGNNLGARALLAQGCDAIILLNPDVELDTGALDQLLSALSAERRIGCAGGIPRSTEGRFSAAVRNRPTFLQKLVVYGLLYHVPPIMRLCAAHFVNPTAIPPGVPIYAVCGACVAFLASAFEQTGGFDEATFLYEEEFIMAERLTAAGWNTVLAHGATYRHVNGLSTRLIRRQRRLHFLRSEFHLVRRYYRWPSAVCVALRAYRHLEWLLDLFLTWCGYNGRRQTALHARRT